MPDQRFDRGRQTDHRQEQRIEDIWQNYLLGGYFDQQGNLRPDFVSRERVEPLVKAMSQTRTPLTMHQMRRYFQHCRAIETRLRSKASTWPAEEAAFRKLDVAAADAFGKRDAKIPQLFHDFIQKNVRVVKSERDFLLGFLPHFEALVGFGAKHLKERERS